ncbi:MAG: hypothetical protein P8I98_05580 [Nitrospinaceae bacterium]|nr:hypothetical protein [Nitrospinaceae bacterium]
MSCSIGTDKTEPLPVKSFSQLSNIEGSSSKLNNSANFKEQLTGKSTNESAHQQLNKKLISREIVVPSEVEGKWNSVKILIQNKEDEELESIHTLKLGSSITPVGSGLTVTVGSFLPNFVMDKKTYTSKGNKLLNPAVQLIVEESGKIIYKGWAFAKFPTMYKFEHKSISIKLLGAMPEVVS